MSEKIKKVRLPQPRPDFIQDGVLHAFSHYDKSKSRVMRLFKPLGLDELKSLTRGTRVWFQRNDGEMQTFTVTSTKTWKTRPGDVDVSIQFGLHNHYHHIWAGGVLDSRCSPLYREVVEAKQ